MRRKLRVNGLREYMNNLSSWRQYAPSEYQTLVSQTNWHWLLVVNISTDKQTMAGLRGLGCPALLDYCSNIASRDYHYLITAAGIFGSVLIKKWGAHIALSICLYPLLRALSLIWSLQSITVKTRSNVVPYGKKIKIRMSFSCAKFKTLSLNVIFGSNAFWYYM